MVDEFQNRCVPRFGFKEATGLRGVIIVCVLCLCENVIVCGGPPIWIDGFASCYQAKEIIGSEKGRPEILHGGVNSGL